MIRILICAKDPGVTCELFRRVGELMRLKPVAFELKQLNDPEKAAEQLMADPLKWDVLILRAGERTGLRLAAIQRRGDLTASIIFICPPDMAIRPLLKFRPGAVLTEAERDDELDRALTWACAEQLRLRKYFAVKNKDMLMRVDIRDILYFESNQRLVTLHTGKKNVVFYAKLTDVLPRLPQPAFVRCHQSYLVNLGAVRVFDRAERRLKLCNGEEIEVSRSFYPEVSRRMEALAERA